MEIETGTWVAIKSQSKPTSINSRQTGHFGSLASTGMLVSPTQLAGLSVGVSGTARTAEQHELVFLGRSPLSPPFPPDAGLGFLLLYLTHAFLFTVSVRHLSCWNRLG